MAHPLESAYSKLIRAKDHIDDFEKRMTALAENDAYQPVHEMNLQAGKYRITLPLPPPSTYLGTILGDIAQNLRSSLDHLVWAVVVSNRSGVEPQKANQIFFPILDAPEDFEKARIKRLLNYLTYEQRALIEVAQPYMRRDKSRRHGFSFLRDLSNADKHQTAPVLVYGVLPEDKPVIGDPVFRNCGELIDPHWVIAHGGLYHGVPLAEFQFTWLRPDSRVDMELEITVQPALREGEHMTPLFPALDNILINAFRLIRQFEGFFPPVPERDGLLERLFPKAVARWRARAAARQG